MRYALLFAMLLLGSLGRIVFGRGDVNMYLHELPLLGYICFWLLQHRGIKIDPISKPLGRAIIIFFTVLSVSFFASYPAYTVWQNVVALLYLARLGVYMGAIWIASTFVTRTNTVKMYFRAYVLLLIGASVVQFVFFPSLLPLHPAGWDPHLYRMVGTMFDSGIAASIYGMLFWAVTHSSLIDSKKMRVYVACALILCVALSMSRAAYVAMFVTMIFVMYVQKYKPWFAKPKRPVFVASVLIVACLLILFGWRRGGEGVNLLRTSTIQSRIADYQEGLILWQQSPIFGIGYNHIRAHKATGYTINANVTTYNHAGAGFHSSFLVILVTGGVAGLIAFIYVLYRFAHISPTLSAQIVYLSTISLFDNALLHPIILMLLTCTVALDMHNKYHSRMGEVK